MTSANPHAYVIRRNHRIAVFDPSKIHTAIMKAFLAIEGSHACDSERIQHTVTRITHHVVDQLLHHNAIVAHHNDRPLLYIEDIQNQVERTLMHNEYYEVARAYIVYREARRVEREHPHDAIDDALADDATDYGWPEVDSPTDVNDDWDRLTAVIEAACTDLDGVDSAWILHEIETVRYAAMGYKELSTTAILTTRTRIEAEPQYSYVTARILLDTLRHEALQVIHEMIEVSAYSAFSAYDRYFLDYIHAGIAYRQLDPRLQGYDLPTLAQALRPERDLQFTYLGLQTLYDRYFLHRDHQRFELPQAFFMRVAMGIALNESEETRTAYAIAFYELLSTFDFMCSTPTLFNSGTVRPQLSSCFLTTIPDDLYGIYDSLRDNAMLSKFAGGLGNDWTPVRAMHAHIKGTNGTSQGVVPFMKVANDTAVAVNQSGKRLGAVCAYLETWHLDIEEFLELRKNTGDERRRSHDMNTANWIPDLFMKRVIEEKEWTLFSPSDVPDLHDLYGQAFEDRYMTYEWMAENGLIKQYKRLPAVQLWHKMLSMLFETGHPWLTFKDPCNIRYTNQHVGIVHSSNLCTEITLHTNADEIAVCNLGSINLPAHITPEGTLDLAKLQSTVQTAIRILDNVIDVNYYSVDKAHDSNHRHRPIGLGIMGFQDALYKLKLPYASAAALTFADTSMEHISYYAIQASQALAVERGVYSTFEGSLWSHGIFPLDSLSLLAQARGTYLKVNTTSQLDWDTLRDSVQETGLRNSNILSIAPTATISNICGVSQSIEPTYQNLFIKSNLSGEFTVINPYLVNDLKARGLWDVAMINDLKYYDGSVQSIRRIPDDIKALYQTAFELDSRWLIEAAARRQKWIDQSQSVNCYVARPSGPLLDALYKYAWLSGLKTTYYLRTLGATHVEKSTLLSERMQLSDIVDDTVKQCSLNNPSCEACQ